MNVTLPIAAILATFVVARLRFKKGEKADSAPVVVPAPEEDEACETEFAAPEVTAGAVSEYVDAARPRQSERRIDHSHSHSTPSLAPRAARRTTQTRTVSTITASDGLVESVQEDEATSKPAIAAIDMEAVATADSFEVTPRKSSISKLMKKVSNVVSSPRKQSTV